MSTSPPPSDRETLRALIAAATPLPWAEFCESDDCWIQQADAEGAPVGIQAVMESTPEAINPENKALVLAAVNALPGLLDHIDRLTFAWKQAEGDISGALAFARKMEQERNAALDAHAAVSSRLEQAEAHAARLTYEIEFLIAIGADVGVSLKPGWIERLQRVLAAAALAAPEREAQ